MTLRAAGRLAGSFRAASRGSSLAYGLTVAEWLWSQIENSGPPASLGGSLFWCGRRSRVTLFGGNLAPVSNFGSTWEWDGGSWTNVEDEGPPARFFASACEYEDGTAILFGGAIAVNLGDTWQWDGAHWAQVADIGPYERVSAAMALEPGTDEVYLFGGYSKGVWGSDTWRFQKGLWTQVGDEGTGPVVTKPQLAWDPLTDRLTLFGSAGGANRTWVWSDGDWTEVQDFGADAGSVLFSTAHGLVAFHTESLKASLWSGQFWSNIQDMGPSPREDAATAWDPVRDRGVLFGGFPVGGIVGARLGDTWELAPPV